MELYDIVKDFIGCFVRPVVDHPIITGLLLTVAGCTYYTHQEEIDDSFHPERPRVWVDSVYHQSRPFQGGVEWYYLNSKARKNTRLAHVTLTADNRTLCDEVLDGDGFSVFMDLKDSGHGESSKYVFTVTDSDGNQAVRTWWTRGWL